MASRQGESFGQTIRRLREAKGWSRRELEDETGVSVKTIGNIENERPEGLNPTRNTVEVLARALGPQVMVAAFPKLVILAPRSRSDSTKRATARKLGRPERGMLRRAEDLVLSASG